MARRRATARPIVVAPDAHPAWGNLSAFLPPPVRPAGTCRHCHGPHATKSCNVADLSGPDAVAFRRVVDATIEASHTTTRAA